MQPQYPEIEDRIQSTFIDAILIIVLMFVAAGILDNFQDVPDWVRISIFTGLFLVYEPLFMTFGCTLGNLIKGIRVRKAADPERRINLLQAIIRYLVKIALGWLSFLTVGANPQRRALHDLISGSVMIRLQPQQSGRV